MSEFEFDADNTDGFEQRVAAVALNAIEAVERGEVDLTMDQLKAGVEEAVGITEAGLHLLKHAGIEGNEAMVIIAAAWACEAYHVAGLDLSPQEVLASLMVARVQHEILFPEEYLHTIYDEEGGASV